MKITVLAYLDKETKTQYDLAVGQVNGVIVARNEANAPLPNAGDGLSDPADRRVEIKL